MRILFRSIAVLLCWVSAAIAQEPVGHAVAVMGNVNVLRAQSQQQEALITNAEIYLNDVIITAADGLVKLLLRDESVLRISPGSELSITSMIAGPGAEGDSTVELLKGRLRSVIGNSLGANSTFSVETPVAVAGVRGTDFEVVHIEINGEWFTGIRCYDGAVLYGWGDNHVLVLAQQFSTSSGDAPPQPPQPISDEQSLIELLGGTESNGIDSLDLGFDASIDEQQVLNLLLLLNPEFPVSVEMVVGELEQIQIQLQQQMQPSVVDKQVNVITEPVQLEGSSLQFDIEIPFPDIDRQTGG